MICRNAWKGGIRPVVRRLARVLEVPLRYPRFRSSPSGRMLRV